MANNDKFAKEIGDNQFDNAAGGANVASDVKSVTLTPQEEHEEFQKSLKKGQPQPSFPSLNEDKHTVDDLKKDLLKDFHGGNNHG